MEPIAFFIVWTVYGCHLPGDGPCWWKVGKQGGPRLPQPLLADWCYEQLNHPIILLDDSTRLIVNEAIAEMCTFRDWHLWVANARTTHVHLVVTAKNRDGKTVRDQFKARCTGELRKKCAEFIGRPVWTRGGWVDRIDDEEALEQAIQYASEGQDRPR